MLFSVIIPTYNRAELLTQTLHSVFAQECKDYEVIVVDDGSTDETEKLVQAHGTQVQLFKQENKGPGVARNLGAKHARGEYLAFLDDDDWWFPWTLTTFAELIQRHNGPAILGAKLIEFSDEAQLAVVPETPPQADVFTDYFASHRSSYFVGAGMAVLRREEFLKTGGYTDKPINAEDHDLILRMGDAKGFVQVKSPVTLGWRRHSGSATTDRRRTFEGNLYLVAQELRRAYPGGAPRAAQRREIIARHARPTVVDGLHEGLRREAWTLYRATFRWHFELGRWKFLVGFPLKACLLRG